MKEGFESVSFHITNFQLRVSVYQFHEFIKEYRARHAKCKKSRIYAFDISTVVVQLMSVQLIQLRVANEQTFSCGFEKTNLFIYGFLLDLHGIRTCIIR